jgi:ribosomal protein S18 acetylase RimI-like enzyme
MITTTRYDGTDALSLSAELGQACATVFDRPSRSREQVAVDYRARLTDDALRPGFRAVVARTTQTSSQTAGFATGWITESPFRVDRAYGDVVRQLGEGAVERHLIGALEVDELAVPAQFRRGGLGGRLLAELVADAPRGRAWLLTSAQNLEAIAFYRRRGWHRHSPDASQDERITIFLAHRS